MMLLTPSHRILVSGFGKRSPVSGLLTMVTRIFNLVPSSIANLGAYENNRALRLLLTSIGSPGKHWSSEKVANTFAPLAETKNTVLDWLTESGIDRSRLSLSNGKPLAS